VKLKGETLMWNILRNWSTGTEDDKVAKDFRRDALMAFVVRYHLMQTYKSC
jgi:hypothetical protein